LAGAAGCGVLQVSPGAMGEVGMVWFRGGQGSGLGCSSLLLHVSRPVFGQGRQGVDSRESRTLLGGHGHVRDAGMHCTK
jgi:hypothetical protein